MTPDQYRREGFRLGIEAAARIVENGYRCESCGQVFLGDNGHSDEDCSQSDPDWGGATDTDKATAIRAIDVNAVLAGLEPVTGGQSVVAVCPICDIELVDCQFTSFSPATDPMARLVKAARVFANWDHCWPGNINLEAACRDIRAALAAMEASRDLR